MTPESAAQIAHFLVSNIQVEIPITAGVFAAVPADGLDYRPHPKSKSTLELLRHLTLEAEWFLNGITGGAFGSFPDHSDACGILTPQDAVTQYQRRVPTALEGVARLPADALMRQLDFFGAFQMPAVGFL